ncbi:longevity assurance proteins LAG1/LAC1 [Coprinopsis marcescibilis]|uniref:Longevity assurance proteins LAG1/LAC1 n=1 Tax=Coprinopsis marcescibilis TaxID=230819 RepID=A0A5C3KRQ0_COPMA|nr:longevity assurance proteins LAG1/LAC1 [Coprinopsis marcescibilis]
MSGESKTARRTAGRPRKLSTAILETDRNHHLTGPFEPQTPLGPLTPDRPNPPPFPTKQAPVHGLLAWAIKPSSALKVLCIPIVLFYNWELVARYVSTPIPNPFGHFFLISGYVQNSKPDDPRYSKSWWDLAFLAYYIVFFSFLRQSIAVKLAHPVARYFGLRKEAKIDRFGEQAYALVYFAIAGAWGYRVMSQLPTFWYKTEHFWLDYPQWAITPELKCYYLMQWAYWWQQFLVLVLGLEKPRKDYWELVAHHFVTIWLIFWGYVFNMTWLGMAVYMSMDIPDAFLALSKLLNYIQYTRAKVVAFVVFMGVWTYFRHYINLRIIWSVVFEPALAPKSARRLAISEGLFLPQYLELAIAASLSLLQILNVFWYYLMWKILIKAVFTREVDDDRSDDEGDDEEPLKKE